MGARGFFSDEQQKMIVDAIISAETNTSAEIRVHLDSACLGSPIKAAIKEFQRLSMDKTESRNGVLVYVAYKSRKCAIVGDSGIDSRVTVEFWDECYALMTDHFKRGEFAEGIVAAVLKAGDKLKELFPYQKDDVNELSDDISFGR